MGDKTLLMKVLASFPLGDSKNGNISSGQRYRAGFTLIEVLLTISLLLILVTLLITNVDTVLGGGKEDVATLWVKQVGDTKLKTFQLHVGRYPSTDEGLQALVTQPGSIEDGWRGPYVDELPEDPWNRPYQYQFPGERKPNGYDLWSMGPDGVSRTEDDIGNW